MKKVTIDLNNYESSDEIKRAATLWEEEMEAGIRISSQNMMRLLPCTFKHVLHDSKIKASEKKKLMEDGLEKIHELGQKENQFKSYYSRNIQSIIELEHGLSDTAIKYLDKYL